MVLVYFIYGLLSGAIIGSAVTIFVLVPIFKQKANKLADSIEKETGIKLKRL